MHNQISREEEEGEMGLRHVEKKLCGIKVVVFLPRKIGRGEANFWFFGLFPCKTSRLHRSDKP